VNEAWVDEKIRTLSVRLGAFRPGPLEFLFEPTEAIYARLGSGDGGDLEYVTSEVSKHVGVSSVPTAKYEWGIMMRPEVAGQIKHSAVMPSIQIPFFYVGRKYAVGRILAHEITHAFLASKRIAANNPSENEMFTDLASVVIGLGKLLLNGLVVMTVECEGEAEVLGYLPPDLVVYCYEKVNACRLIGAEAAMRNLTPEAKQRIEDFRMKRDKKQDATGSRP